MPSYTTPDRYRRGNFGVDLTEIGNIELRGLIETASVLANVICAVPKGHDFRGGKVRNERHRFDVGNVWRRGSGRVFPRHRPIISLDSFTLDVSNKIQVSFPTDTFYVNPAAGFVEVSDVAYGSLTGLVLAQYYPVGMTYPVARIDYTYGFREEITEPLTTTSGTNILAGSVPFWSESDPVTITKNGLALPNTEYSVDYDEGQVAFSNYDANAVYEASYVARLPSPIEQATRLIVTELIGYRAINAGGLLGMSRIRVEEIEISPSGRWGFGVESISAAPKQLLAPYSYLVIG